jgi:hypothetical protein
VVSDSVSAAMIAAAESAATASSDRVRGNVAGSAASHRRHVAAIATATPPIISAARGSDQASWRNSSPASRIAALGRYLPPHRSTSGAATHSGTAASHRQRRRGPSAQPTSAGAVAASATAGVHSSACVGRTIFQAATARASPRDSRPTTPAA